MCGLVGIYHLARESLPTEYLDRRKRDCMHMLDALWSRGPDDHGLAVMGNTLLGHRRLSIIDLETGNQPLFNEDHTVGVVLNGEIYNHDTLRRELIDKGHHFVTQSDTEVLVHLYEEMGEGLFTVLNGMFAILLYDVKKDIFLAARDRLGEKPLVYSENRDSVVFASEIKALLRYPEGEQILDPQGLALYFNAMYVPAPCSIFKGIRKVPPAHYMRLEGNRFSLLPYWHPPLEVNWEMTETEAIEGFMPLLSDAVRIRKAADVPIGVFLSGGIDSSAVTAFMADHCGHTPVRTFSVGFSDEVDERPFAAMVAERYRTDHTEIHVRDNVHDAVVETMNYFDEPFGDSSAVPTFLIAREARQFVKVILTGDGGDELFAGYPSYLDQRYLWGGKFTSRLLKETHRFAVDRLGLRSVDSVYSRTAPSGAWAHWHRVRSIMSQEEIDRLLSGSSTRIEAFYRQHLWLKLADTDPLNIAFSRDLNYYLPDDLLKKVDMASMKASLECRAPFLDHRLVAFAMTIPPHLKMKHRQLKYLLKKGLARHLPREILYRRKQGFGAPVTSWLEGPLKEMVNDCLQPGCRSETYLDRTAVAEILSAFYHERNRTDFRIPFKVWLIFMFELWLRRYQ